MTKPGTSGLPYDGVEIAVVDEDWNNPQPQAWPHADHQREKDHTAPLAIATASFKKDRRNTSPTKFVQTPNRGHWLVFDSGWHEVADRALGFLKQHY